jgi:peptide/nickel transport system permease protein
MTDVMPAATIEAAAALAGGTGTGRGVNWILRGAQVWLGSIVVLTVVYPWLPFVEDPMRVGAGPPQTGPSGEFWFGTSTLGQDVFAQVLEGGRISLRVAAIGTIVGIGLGGLLGLLAGYLRGWVDWVVRLIINVTLSVPALVLVTFIVAVRDQSLYNVTLAICILAVPAIARIARASTLQVAEREYVKAAEVIGARKLTILWREVLPNVMPTLVSFSFLSFLGLSVKQPAITWGSIIAEGRIAFDKTPHMVFLPGLVLFLTVLSLNFIGDHLLKRYDIRESNL